MYKASKYEVSPDMKHVCWPTMCSRSISTPSLRTTSSVVWRPRKYPVFSPLRHLVAEKHSAVRLLVSSIARVDRDIELMSPVSLRPPVSSSSLTNGGGWTLNLRACRMKC
ncbi:hypothetical protein MHYP_G00020390 [Metynnis hypsauchen]